MSWRHHGWRMSWWGCAGRGQSTLLDQRRLVSDGGRQRGSDGPGDGGGGLPRSGRDHLATLILDRHDVGRVADDHSMVDVVEDQVVRWRRHIFRRAAPERYRHKYRHR